MILDDLNLRSLKYAYHLEFVMAPNVYYNRWRRIYGLGGAVHLVCYDGNSFGPMYNFRDIDGIVKVRARSRSFPVWESTWTYSHTLRDLFIWTAMCGWVLEDYVLVRTEEPYYDSCIKRGVPAPDYDRDRYPLETPEDILAKLKEECPHSPFPFSCLFWKDFMKQINFAKEREVTEKELEALKWPTKEMITDTYPTYRQFT